MNSEQSSKTAGAARPLCYCLTEQTCAGESGVRVGYGLAVLEEETVLQRFEDLCSRPERLEQLVNRCNRGALSHWHIRDVLEDFLP